MRRLLSLAALAVGIPTVAMVAPSIVAAVPIVSALAPAQAEAGVPPGCSILAVGLNDLGFIQGWVEVRCTKHYDITYELHEQVYGAFWFETSSTPNTGPAFGSPGNSNNTYYGAMPYSGCAHYRIRARTWISTDGGKTTYVQDSYTGDLPWAPIYHAGCA